MVLGLALGVFLGNLACYALMGKPVEGFWIGVIAALICLIFGLPFASF